MKQVQRMLVFFFLFSHCRAMMHAMITHIKYLTPHFPMQKKRSKYSMSRFKIVTVGPKTL